MNEIKQKISHLLSVENETNKNFLHLTANETVLSSFVKNALSSPLSTRYHIGTLKDFVGVNEIISTSMTSFHSLQSLYELEKTASDILNERLGGCYTDFRPLSGVHAMICTILSTTKIGDYVLSLNPESGGHFATINIINSTGRKSLLLDINEYTLSFDEEILSKYAKKYNIKLIFIDDNLAMFPLDIKKIRDICGKNTIIAYDASHSMGFLFSKKYLRPIKDGCDIIQGNTHKTLLGPQKALIHFKDSDLAYKVIENIGAGLVSSQHTHETLALYLAVIEMKYCGEEFINQLHRNVVSFSKELKNKGFNILSLNGNFSETHQVYIYIPKGKDIIDIEKLFAKIKISLNKRVVFGKYFIRVGFQETTRLGMKEDEMKQIAEIFDLLILKNQIEESSRMVKRLINEFNNIHYSFDAIV